MKKAIQMYSVRDHIKTGDDMLEILGEVKKLGFDGVEFAGYYGLSAETLKARRARLRKPSGSTKCWDATSSAWAARRHARR